MRGAWEEDGYDPEDDDLSEADNTIWKTVVRAVAAILLFSMLGGLLIAWRSVEGMIAIGALVLIGLIAAIVSKNQREAEDPYGADDPPGPVVH